jgi:hypothetical protein
MRLEDTRDDHLAGLRPVGALAVVVDYLLEADQVELLLRAQRSPAGAEPVREVLRDGDARPLLGNDRVVLRQHQLEGILGRRLGALRRLDPELLEVLPALRQDLHELEHLGDMLLVLRDKAGDLDRDVVVAAAHRVAPRRGQRAEGVALQGHRLDPGNLLEVRLDLAVRRGGTRLDLDQHVGERAANHRLEIALKAIHHAQDDDDRPDAEHDADDRDEVDPPGAEQAQGHDEPVRRGGGGTEAGHAGGFLYRYGSAVWIQSRSRLSDPRHRCSDRRTFRISALSRSERATRETLRSSTRRSQLVW